MTMTDNQFHIHKKLAIYDFLCFYAIRFWKWCSLKHDKKTPSEHSSNWCHCFVARTECIRVEDMLAWVEESIPRERTKNNTQKKRTQRIAQTYPYNELSSLLKRKWKAHKYRQNDWSSVCAAHICAE